MSTVGNKKKWIFLDRDGTLIKDKGHIYKVEDLEILPGVIKGLCLLKNLGFRFIVVTNQAGIAKGYYTHEDAHAFNDELCKRLAQEYVVVEAFYLCPHHPNHTGTCLCRKPKTGLLEKAARDFSISPDEAILVGDKDSDIEAGKRWGCKTFKIKNDQYPDAIKADFYIKDLVGLAKIFEESQIPFRDR